MAPQTPQIVKDVMSLFRRERKQPYYGNSVFRVNQGYRLGGSRRKAGSNQMWMETGDEPSVDMNEIYSTEEESAGRTSAGTSNEVYIDEEAAGRVRPRISEAFPMEEVEAVRQQQIVPDIIGASFTSDITADQVLLDIDSESSMEEEKAARQVDSNTRSESVVADNSFRQMVPEIASGSSADDVSGRVIPFRGGPTNIEREEAVEQMDPEIHGEPATDNISSNRIISGADDVSRTDEVPDKQQVPDIDKRPPSSKVVFGPTSSGITGVPFYKKEAPDSVGSEVIGKKKKIQSNQETYKEGQMDDAYYVARDGNESSLVRRMHPDCTVTIPDDYDEAVEEIRTCPLNCPYKLLEFAVLDQKALQRRPK